MEYSCTEKAFIILSEINEETLSGVELVPPGVREDLRAIAAWLDKHNKTDRLTVYAKLRSDALSQSLKVLNYHWDVQNWLLCLVVIVQLLTSHLLAASGTAGLPAQQQHRARPDHRLTQLSRAATLKTCKNGQHLKKPNTKNFK